MTDAPLRDRLRALPEPDREFWADDGSFAIEPTDEAELITLATDRSLLDAEEGSHDYWVPVHAWRALGVLRSERAVVPLLDVLRHWDGDDWIGRDFPEVLGRIGGAAIPPLRALGLDAQADEIARMNAAEALARVGVLHPTERHVCVEALTAMLEHYQRDSEDLNALVVGCLIDLEAVEAAPLIEAAFAAGKVDDLFVGDWEDVQVELGLLDERVTPRTTPEPPPDWLVRELRGPSLPGSGDLGLEAAAVLGSIFEAERVRGPIRSLRQLEGFLFTIACVPEVVPPSRWIDFLLKRGLSAASEAEAGAVIQALILFYNEIQTVVNRPRFLPPDGLFEDDPVANLEPGAEASEWAKGFLIGHSWLEEAWEAADPNGEALAMVLFMLSFFSSHQLAEAFRNESTKPDLPLADVAAMVQRQWPRALTEYAAIGRAILRDRVAANRPQPVRASAEQRTGRNDPCPCGSGRKFKKCCGKEMH